jgi:hypothetical protein
MAFKSYVTKKQLKIQMRYHQTVSYRLQKQQKAANKNSRKKNTLI